LDFVLGVFLQNHLVTLNVGYENAASQEASFSPRNFVSVETPFSGSARQSAISICNELFP
jgi:hypothetical protein